ncbi:MAG: conserved hypothetical protein [Marine Group I thaumarchaeote]|nr:MAG: conserved hypothetical protein [Marine Group I thaumarchaeote]
MDLSEHIQAHLLSVWREEKKLFSRAREGMLFLTERHLMFVSKTDAKMKWWGAITQRQVLTLMKSKNTMIHQDGYDEHRLIQDLENKKNMEVSLDRILDISSEEKSWGSVLKLEINMGETTKKYQFSIVQDWVKYPIKDPTKYMKVDWSPFVDYIKDRQKAMR